MIKYIFILFCKDSAAEVAPLTEDEIAHALTTENRQLIDTLYAIACNLYSNESDRAKSIDSKAAALFGFVGAFISAIFVVLGFMGDAKNTKLVTALSGNTLYLLVIVLGLLGASLMALFFAVVVKKGWKAPGDRDLFEAVHKYDGHVPGGEKNHEMPSHDYKRHLIEHFWKLYKACFKENESKAQALFIGQLAVFLGLLLLIAVQVVAVLAFRTNMSTPNDQSPKSPAPASTAIAPATPATSSEGRPAPLAVSSKGTLTRDGADNRPAPLQASSDGQNKRLSEGRLAPPTSSGVGQIGRDSADVKLTKGK